MGREQRRKEEKKHKNKSVELENTSEEMIKVSSILKIILAVVVIILVFYYGLAIFVTKEVDLSSNNKNNNVSNNSDDSSNSVSNAILAKNTFNQLEDVYYVYYYDFNDEEDAIASSIGNLDDYKIYRVDTSSGLNNNYVDASNGNKSVTDISNLKVMSPTLIKIDNDKVVDYYEGVEEISKFLNE